MATETSSTAETAAWVLLGVTVIAGAGYGVKRLADASSEKAALEAQLAQARIAQGPVFTPAVPRPGATAGQKVVGAVGSVVNALGGFEGIVNLIKR